MRWRGIVTPSSTVINRLVRRVNKRVREVIRRKSRWIMIPRLFACADHVSRYCYFGADVCKICKPRMCRCYVKVPGALFMNCDLIFLRVSTCFIYFLRNIKVLYDKYTYIIVKNCHVCIFMLLLPGWRYKLRDIHHLNLNQK